MTAQKDKKDIRIHGLKQAVQDMNNIPDGHWRAVLATKDGNDVTVQTSEPLGYNSWVEPRDGWYDLTLDCNEYRRYIELTYNRLPSWTEAIKYAVHNQDWDDY